MADKMAVYGLRHKRSRLASEITKLTEWNLRNISKIADLQAQVASNLEKISAYATQIDDLGRGKCIFDRI